MTPAPAQDKNPTRRSVLRFQLSTLLIITLVVSAVAAATGYLVRSARPETSDSVASSAPSGALVFLLFTVAAPVLLMIAVSLTRRLFSWLARQR